MGSPMIDTSATPVYVHAVYHKITGNYLFLKYSFSNYLYDEYIYFQKRQNEYRVNLASKLAQMSPDEKRIFFTNEFSLSETDHWEFHISKLLPWNEYNNNGSRRRTKLKKRISLKYPLFADQFISQELNSDPDYYSGNSVIDKRKISFREQCNSEYWSAYHKAMLESHYSV